MRCKQRWRRLIAVLLAACFLTGCLSQPDAGSNGPESEASVRREMRSLADTAMNDLLGHFWQGDATDGHLIKEDHGYPTEGKQTMIWAHAMLLLAMETMEKATGDESLRERIAAQWTFTRDNFTEEQLVRAGQWPNIAVDDASWDAMAYMLWYRVTGDPYALRIAGRLIRNSYEYWKDGDVSNGLWYPQTPPSQGGDENSRFKSLYCVGLLLAALEYTEVTGEQPLYEDTLKIYEWIEQNLRRDGEKEYDGRTITCSDHLYWVDFNVDRPGRGERNGPDGGTRPLDIQEASSVSSVGGNMAMGVLQARLYRRTGEERYLTRALETVRALSGGPYNRDGVLLNDRDAWTTAAFSGLWVSEVLTLPGVEQKDKDLIFGTARSIAANARTPEGYYGGSWSGPAEGNASAWYRAGSKPEQIMTSANSAHMILAAALLEKQENGE